MRTAPLQLPCEFISSVPLVTIVPEQRELKEGERINDGKPTKKRKPLENRRDEKKCHWGEGEGENLPLRETEQKNDKRTIKPQLH